MKQHKYIAIEYFVLFSILLIVFINKYFFIKNINSSIFSVFIFIIYLRHYHLGDKIIVEYKQHYYITRNLSKRKPQYLLDAPSFILMILFLSDKICFEICALIFLIWFIITDIFRQRVTIYGTYISRWFYTSKIEINNTKWELHIGDKDPFPSIPHMHSKNYPLKLNIYTGEIYDTKTKKIVYIAKDKELKKLWTDEKFIIAVDEARKFYLSSHRNEKLPSYDHLMKNAKINK